MSKHNYQTVRRRANRSEALVLYDDLVAALNQAAKHAKELEAEVNKLRAELAADAGVQPCGHGTKWIAYRDGTDPNSERYCVFCEVERLRALLNAVTNGAEWCGFVTDGVAINVHLWNLTGCDGRRSGNLIEAADAAKEETR